MSAVASPMDLIDAVEALPEPVVDALARRLAPALREHLAEDDRCSCVAAGQLSPVPGGSPPARPRTSLPPSLADDVWFTTAEAAEYTRRHPNTVLSAAEAEVLQSTQAGRGRGRRYRKEWLDEWLGPVGEPGGR